MGSWCLQKWEREGRVPGSLEASWRIQFKDYITVSQKLPFPSRNRALFAKRLDVSAVTTHGVWDSAHRVGTGTQRASLCQLPSILFYGPIYYQKSTFYAVLHLTWVVCRRWMPGKPRHSAPQMLSPRHKGRDREGNLLPQGILEKPPFPPDLQEWLVNQSAGQACLRGLHSLVKFSARTLQPLLKILPV